MLLINGEETLTLKDAELKKIKNHPGDHFVFNMHPSRITINKENGRSEFPRRILYDPFL